MEEADEYESLPPSATVATHIIAGAAAGVLEHCLMYPIDSVKVLSHIHFNHKFKSEVYYEEPSTCFTDGVLIETFDWSCSVCIEAGFRPTAVSEKRIKVGLM
jgi:hypothetical protein